ncbi:hypothetical protein FRB97_001834 [Tulasnella sp. 331]|nr:hypothetical protein FRB97_001834 [Tulasnella sp. 331]
MATTVARLTHPNHLDHSLHDSVSAATNDISPAIPNSAPTDIFSISDEELQERLQFISEIGFGNWGSVWSCYTNNTPTRDKVAVKLVHRSKTPTTAARVKSLEYLPRLIPVEVNEIKAKPWFESLLSGVHFLHAHGVSHNDIKPANILLTACSVPVLVDFGFAEYHGSWGTFKSTLAYGTPEYLDPLRAKGLSHDTRLSDIYSLGVTFFEILVGRTPFEEVEGEAFETQEDLEVYWKRTMRGVWLGDKEWKKKLSVGVESLLKRMMCPDPAGRLNAEMALEDPYWKIGTVSSSSSKRLGEFTSRLGMTNTSPAKPRAILPPRSPVKSPKVQPIEKEKKTPKKESSKLSKKNAITKDRIGSPTTPARPVNLLGITQPVFSPGVTTPSTPSTVRTQQRAISPTSMRPSPSGIPVARRRAAPTHTHTTPFAPSRSRQDSDKENGRADRPRPKRAKTSTSRKNDENAKSPAPSTLGGGLSFLSEKYHHISRKTPSRKPIPAVLQTGSEDRRANPIQNPRARVASIVNKTAVAGNETEKIKPVRQRVASIVNKSAIGGTEPRKKSLIGQAGKEARDKALKAVRKVEEGLASVSAKMARGEERDVKVISNQPEVPDYAFLASPPKAKPVLELVKEIKERQRRRDREQSDCVDQQGEDAHYADVSFQTTGADQSVVIVDAPHASVSMMDIHQADIPSPTVVATSPRDNMYPRSAKSSTSVFRHGIKASMGKLSKFSLGVGSGKQPTFSMVDIPDVADFSMLRDDDFSARRPTAPSGTFSRSQPCLQTFSVDEEDRMTQWIKSVERVVEETRTNFLANGEVVMAPGLPPLPPPRRASITTETALGIGRYNGTANMKRRATIAGDPGMLVLRPSIGKSVENEASLVVREDIAAATTDKPKVGVGMQQKISSVANLELELEKTRAPQRLSAVIDPAGLAAQFTKQDLVRTSAESTATAVDNPGMLSVLAKANNTIPCIEVTEDALLVSPSTSPISSMSKAYRNSASSVFLLDRLGPPEAESLQQLSSTSSRTSLGLATQPSQPDYDRLLLSSSGVVRLGQGYQSEHLGRQNAQEFKFDTADPTRDAQRKKLHRRSLFKKGWGVPTVIEPPTEKTHRDPGAKSSDDFKGKRNESACLGVPGRALGEQESVAGRMKKALQTILSTPRRPRTFIHAQ